RSLTRCLRERAADRAGSARGSSPGHPEASAGQPRSCHSRPHRWLLLPGDDPDPRAPDRNCDVSALSRTSHAAGLPSGARSSDEGSAMTCDEFVSVIDLYLDGELSVMHTLRVHGHVTFCESCRRVMESEAALHSLLAVEAGEEEPPGALRERILGRVLSEDVPS